MSAPEKHEAERFIRRLAHPTDPLPTKLPTKEAAPE